jgi:flagella basal body P-ring formation protein FlgA
MQANLAGARVANGYVRYRPQLAMSRAAWLNLPTMHLVNIPFLLVLTLFGLPAIAQNPQATVDPSALRSAVETFMASQIKDFPGQPSYEIGEIKGSKRLGPCDALSVAVPAGGKTWGRISLTVRCTSGNNWMLQVPVRVRVMAEFLVSTRPLSPGVVLTTDDFMAQSGDLTELPAGILTDPAQVIGRISRAALPAGRPLRADMLRSPTVIQQGQSVKVSSRGPGFEVANEGRALRNASAGEVVQVRLGNGSIVSGVAQSNGSVEIKR